MMTRERETNTQRGDNNLKIEGGGEGGVPHVLLCIACVFVLGVAHKHTFEHTHVFVCGREVLP